MFFLTSVQAETATSEIPLPILVEATIDTPIYAQIGDEFLTVGKVHKGYSLMVVSHDEQRYAIAFGHALGFVDIDAVKPRKKDRYSESLAVMLRPKTNQNIITTQSTAVYAQPNNRKSVVAELAENLRYPITSKQEDSSGNLWYEINLGDRTRYIRADDCQIDNGIPVLTFHHFLQDSENKLFLHTSTTTSDSAFAEQMGYLKREGYQTISMYQLEDYIYNRINLPAKVMVLTFDDGLKSVYRYAYPILKANGFHGTAFIISSRIKRHPQKWNPASLEFMSVGELYSLRDIFDIQSHTHFLHRLNNKKQPILLSRSEHNIVIDFERSRRGLRQFNRDIRYLSYPFGGYNAEAIEAARIAGYSLAVTTMEGKVKPGDNPYTLKRLYILRTDTITDMMDLIANQPELGTEPKPEKPPRGFDPEI